MQVGFRKGYGTVDKVFMLSGMVSHFWNKHSKLYCAIAAYNTGPGNVSKAFTGLKDVSGAIGSINNLSPDDLYTFLTQKLPYKETREYLVKVTERIKMYKSWMEE